MAVATFKRDRVSEVTVTMNRQEALAVIHALRVTSGNVDGTAKGLTENVRRAIQSAFSGDINFNAANSFEVFGGRAAVRTDSLANLETGRIP